MSKRESRPPAEAERPGLIGKILRRTRSKQNVSTHATQMSTPVAATSTTPDGVTSPGINNLVPDDTQQHSATVPEARTATSRSENLGHKSKPSLVSLMQQPAASSNREPFSTVDTTPAQPKVTLRSRFNKNERVQHPVPRRTQSQDGSGYSPQHAAATFQRTTGLSLNSSQSHRASVPHAPHPSRHEVRGSNAHIMAAVPVNYEPHVEIHDGTEDDSSDYQKFIQEAIEEDRRQREVWRSLASQQTYKVVAVATGPPPKPGGLFSWQRSAAKKQKEEEERRRTFAGEGQLYGFPASEASCELSRKSSRASSRLSRKSSLKQMIVDYIKPPQQPSEYEMAQYGVKRKTSSKHLV
ncbi:uncharacterized protein B0I36DRAFT_361073 [Microdochium trichocladiopsis]|uniref:Uncharacterized protein n=1 Tax=Microdochium trichocladiopsis TaxID=1682393 RepID=A0A9P9BTM1_9PEZI|nr:uncharacterized protein B0I36DRAFT_361073 [Microdochium trichocladiopsis]KAH7035744.1 hypothetical protein B0I36DRAFT_361073 [Microdochium trichocladiopsis]